MNLNDDHTNEVKAHWRHSMSSKNIDLILFSETGLHSSIGDSILHLNNYDLIRRDRSKNGGEVCTIYLRSSINYNIRNDLIPTELDAVYIEIIKPHSKPFLVTTVYRPPNSSAETIDDES